MIAWLSARSGHLDVADAEPVARPDAGPAPTELFSRLRIAVEHGVGIRFGQFGQPRRVGVIGVLMCHEDGVEAGDAFESVREVAGIEEDLRAVQLHEHTGMAKMCQSHDFEYAPAPKDSQAGFTGGGRHAPNHSMRTISGPPGKLAITRAFHSGFAH